MENIYKTLWLGSAVDYETLQNKNEWFVLHMAKEPYYRELTNNYGREPVPSDKDYFFIEKDNRIAFNLMDYGNPNSIPKEIFLKAINVINEKVLAGKNVLVHCTFGRSRSASVVLLYLFVYTNILDGLSFSEAETKFVEIYPRYQPSLGVNLFLEQNWQEFAKLKKVSKKNNDTK